MSEALATIDLSTIAIGGTSRIDLTKATTAYNNPSEQASAHIRIYNDSGSTLKIRSDTGTIQDYIPAGAWLTYPIDHSVQAIDITVIGILPNAPIQLLMPTYFAPGEEVPDTPQLGNSPVGIGNSLPINTTATAVANDGNAAGTVFFESSIGGIVHSQGFNDGFLLFQKDATSADVNLQAWIDLAASGHNWELWLKTGATHALYINDVTSGKTGLLMASDGSAQLANLQVTVDANGNVIIPGVFKTTHPMGAADEDMVEIAPSDDASIDFTLRAAFAGSDLLVFDKKNSTEIARFRNGAGANSGLILSAIGGRMRAWSQFTFGGGGGFTNHGLGAIPTMILGMQNIAGTETLGWVQATATATQVNITTGAANGGVAMALLMV